MTIRAVSAGRGAVLRLGEACSPGKALCSSCLARSAAPAGPVQGEACLQRVRFGTAAVWPYSWAGHTAAAWGCVCTRHCAKAGQSADLPIISTQDIGLPIASPTF